MPGSRSNSADIIRDSLIALGRQALAKARARCPSRTLQRALRMEIDEEKQSVRITVPHYWAVFYHDGRGPIQARPGHFLVFYKNLEDDPRLRGGYPEKRGDIRRLSRTQFYRDLRAGKLIVTRSVGPAPGHKFLDKLDLLSTVSQRLKLQFGEFVRKDVAGLLSGKIKLL